MNLGARFTAEMSFTGEVFCASFGFNKLRRCPANARRRLSLASFPFVTAWHAKLSSTLLFGASVKQGFRGESFSSSCVQQRAMKPTWTAMHPTIENRPQVPRDRLLRLTEVELLVGLKKSTIYHLMRQEPPAFPRCVQITPRCVAWPESHCLQWVQDRIAETRGSRSASLV